MHGMAHSKGREGGKDTPPPLLYNKQKGLIGFNGVKCLPFGPMFPYVLYKYKAISLPYCYSNDLLKCQTVRA